MKYAVTAKSIWEVVCIDCVGHATYFWELQSLNEVGQWLKVHEYETDTGIISIIRWVWKKKNIP
jgi:hypothetical protein